MFGRPDQPAQHWSVHAEFTISHPGVNDPENQPQTNTEHGDNGVRMTYTWTSQENSSSNSNRSLNSEPVNNKPTTSYQRGNLFFTSTPPRKPFNLGEVNQRLGVHDSGYGSDLLSPNSLASGSLPRRVIQPYNRKCRSTCNIVLSSNVQDQNAKFEDSNNESGHVQCGRTQSLRCQTPTIRCDRKDNFYGCGDPWCHHLHYGDEFSCPGRISPVMEACEDCTSATSTKRPSRANTFSHNVNRKDASVQTFEMIDKCTSPFMKVDTIKESRKKYSSGLRRRTEPIPQRIQSPASITPDSLDSLQLPRRIARSPNVRRTIAKSKIKQKSTDTATASDSKSSDTSKKQPRTVHIDVYCTGTELESDSSTSSSENETASTPQTVFESDKIRITHKRAENTDIPITLQEKQEPEDKKEESDGETSVGYPSKQSSYSTMRDLSSSISSVPPSWTTYSMSSCTVPDDYDSVANTSWKDTFSDIESLLQSRTSLAQTDSLDFVPRRLLDKHSSIDETPEIEKKPLEDQTPSTSSLQPSDSFEYANSEDRLRIKRMEEMWKANSPITGKQWKSPISERKLLLQQKKMQEYIDKRLSNKNIPKQSDSDGGSDESEKGWTFVKGPEITKNLDRGSLSDSSTSPKSSVQRLSLDPTLRSPFTILPGFYTEPRFIAKKFGKVLNVVRKPGHHIGPAKNPDCLCDHCQKHFESVGFNRSRTRSMGDSPTRQVLNWKEFIRPAKPEPRPDVLKNRPVYTDF